MDTDDRRVLLQIERRHASTRPLRRAKVPVEPMQLHHFAPCASRGCDTAAVTYAGVEIPMCRDHAESAVKHLRVALAAQRRFEQEIVIPPRPRPRIVDPTRVSIVYYARIVDRVKIGVTTNPVSRWTSLKAQYGAFELLVVEPGDATQEVARHAQFAHLRDGQTELFRHEEYLMAHVVRLQAQHPDWRDLARAAHEAAKAARCSKGHLHLEQWVAA